MNEKILNCFRRNQYPQQAILFEYFLDRLFTELEQTRQPTRLPMRVASHLFLYAGLIAGHLRGQKNGVPEYFPHWHLEIKTDLEYYAAWLPTKNLLSSPLLFFSRTGQGLHRRIIPPSDFENKVIRLSFGFSENPIPNKDELFALVFAEDKIAAAKNDLDMAFELIKKKMESWPAEFLQTTRPFSTWGFLASLALPQKTFLSALEKGHLTVDHSADRDMYLIMDTALRDDAQLYPFSALKTESLMMHSELYDLFISYFMHFMRKTEPQIYENMSENIRTYNKTGSKQN